MQPLKVTIKLRSPMVEPRQALHLDALLSALRVSAAEQEGINDPNLVQHDLPVERYVAPSGEWVFKASAFNLRREAPAMPWMQTGRSDLVMAAEDRASGFLKLRGAKPNTAGGPFKASKYTIDIVWSVLEAFVVGDKAGIESLLADCKQVGGRRGTGHGCVDSISVVEVTSAECAWYNRSLPEDFEGIDGAKLDLVRRIGALRSPYWMKALHKVVLSPLSH
ncbi:hypothetical protein ACYPKM_00745 [Pseudomonas aeruginosa]